MFLVVVRDGLSSGKIGAAVCKLLLQKGDVEICIFSSFASIVHPRVKYTQDISAMSSYKVVLIGKALKPSIYRKALANAAPLEGGMQYLLDYTVPFFQLVEKGSVAAAKVRHTQIAVLKVTNQKFLKGYFDVCMGTSQVPHIYLSIFRLKVNEIFPALE